MVIVGLTGGIGAGKSFIATLFKEKGIPIYNSDNRAKELMATNAMIKKKLINKFGSEVFIKNTLNRKLIADNIFNNKPLIEWINKIVHPIVKNDFEKWTRLQKSPFIIKEAAILIESGAYEQCDIIIVVTAPVKTRRERVILRDNLTINEVNKRINNQISDEKRIEYANYTIINDGIKIVTKQVNEIYTELNKTIDC